MAERRMPGLWESPVSPRALAGALRLSELHADPLTGTLAWLEGRSDRGVIVVHEPGTTATRDLTPAASSVRAMVGYGGGDFTLADGAAYFVDQADQRIYRQELAGGPPRPITPAFGAAASPAVSPDGRWVAYVHTYEDRDCIAIVDAEGSQWPSRLAHGRDFYMQPAWHPDSTTLAWVEWDHPQMPWDGTDLVLAGTETIGAGLPHLQSVERVAGGTAVAAQQPLFSADGQYLYYISDEDGIGQVYRRHLTTGEVVQLSQGEGDFGSPAWPQGLRLMTEVGGQVTATRNLVGFDTLELLDQDGGTASSPPLPGSYMSFASPTALPDGRLAAIASGGAQPPRVITIDLTTPMPVVDVLRRSDSETTPAHEFSQPEAISWEAPDGETVHGIYYPPHNPRFTFDGPAPLIVLPHGGPTSQATASWSPQAQFFATRGYGVLFPNYRGSTGYGREYMLRLREKWGVYDVQDCRSGAEALVARGLADPSRLVIMGGSAGGYTVLQSLVDFPGFYRAGICMYGISDQFSLAAETHKFEARYSDQLLGPLPEAAARYRDRSPLFHADRIQDPVALFQGDVDRVVPKAQSDAIAASLRARGVPHEYAVYEGEGHGWRKSETIEHFYGAVERFLRTYVLYS